MYPTSSSTLTAIRDNSIKLVGKPDVWESWKTLSQIFNESSQAKNGATYLRHLEISEITNWRTLPWDGTWVQIVSNTAPRVGRWPTEQKHLPTSRQQSVQKCPTHACSHCQLSLHTLSTTCSTASNQILLYEHSVLIFSITLITGISFCYKICFVIYSKYHVA